MKFVVVIKIVGAKKPMYWQRVGGKPVDRARSASQYEIADAEKVAAYLRGDFKSAGVKAVVSVSPYAKEAARPKWLPPVKEP